MGRHLSYTGNVVTGTLNSGIAASGTTTFQVTGWPSSVGISGQPFVVEVGPGLGDDEKILISTFAAGVATIDTRGWDSTSAVAHSTGEQVKIVWDATSAQDVSDHLYVTSRDDHTQYLTTGRHDLTARHGSGVVTHGLIGGLSADDHGQYYNQARHDAHPHPAGAFGAASIPRGVLIGMAGLPIGMEVVRHGGISGSEALYLLPQDGSDVSRAAWPLLFAQIGVLYGVGDGSTTFTLPDKRARVTVGACATPPDGSRSARVEGATGGEETHIISSGEMPVHSHTVTDSGHTHSLTDPSHAHSGIHASGLGGTNGGYIAAEYSGSTEGTQSAGHTTGLTFVVPGSVGTAAASSGITAANGHAALSATNTGSGSAHNNMPPFIAVPVFIVAA